MRPMDPRREGSFPGREAQPASVTGTATLSLGPEGMSLSVPTRVEGDVAVSAVARFASGATRDTDAGKLDYEGFLSPLVLRRFAQYMHKHRTQSDGTVRAGDNWQRGMTRKRYRQSLLRHVMELWLVERGALTEPVSERDPQDEDEILCAILFNAQGLLLERLLGRDLAA